jgi:OmpA-OmpF porin, OOP family
MKRILLMMLLLPGIVTYGQRKSAIGFSANLTDFETPAKIRASSLGDVLKDGIFGKVYPGISLMYWQGLGKRTDFSIRYNGVFGDGELTSSKSNVKEYYNELEGSLHLRAFTDEKTFNPFLTAGVGIGNYWKNAGVAGYAPLGVGLQVNLLNETYIFLQGNYRWSFERDKLPNNLFYSLGFTQAINSPRQKRQPITIPIPIMEDTDRDKDGVDNNADDCPDAAGTSALKGCPDGDNDGVADKDDKCPTVNGPRKYQGCPVPDTDNDNINDEDDKCPNVAGTARYGGCPVPDSDNDGINDDDDKCPDVAGIASNRGCPEIKKEITEKVNLAARNIYFMSGKDIIQKKSFGQLNNVAAILKADRTLRLHVTGHTDNTGSSEVNDALSAKRALAVKNYLINQGIEEEQITTMGKGSSEPIADNATAAGRTKNRRVEMSIRNY